MTYQTIRTTVLGAATAVASIAILVAGAQAQVQRQTMPAANLKANVEKQKVTPVPCNSVSACNSIIAYCAANNGNWIESSHNEQGQPSKGTCYLD